MKFIIRLLKQSLFSAILLLLHSLPTIAGESPLPMFLPAIIAQHSSAAELPSHWKAGLDDGVNWGLAAAYPNDLGIANHPAVLAAENFETGTVSITTEEDRYRLNTNVVNSHAYTGQYSGEHRWEKGYNGPTTRYQIPSTAHQGDRSTYFVRMCFNFDRSFRPNDGKTGVGVKGFGVVSDPDNKASTTNPCNGTNWYNAQAQFVGWGPSSKPQANDGYLWVGHLYSYSPYPEQAKAALGEIRISDPPVGNRPYRFSSYATPFTYLDFSRWHCYEVGLYLNTPGKFNGEARFWIDGVLQSRVTAIRYRDIASLLPTDMHLNLHRVTDDFPQTMLRWTDNIVLATRYIGPVKKQ